MPQLWRLRYSLPRNTRAFGGFADFCIDGWWRSRAILKLSPPRAGRLARARGQQGRQMQCIRSGMGPIFSRKYSYLCVGAVATLLALPAQIARADEGGVSFWIPGFFGSLAATPTTPGWSGTTIYYHGSVSAGGDVARAREFEIRNIPVNFTGNVSARAIAQSW